jgi:hypothetical protein
MPMIGRAILRLSPIALLVVLAACGGGGTKTVTVTVAKPEIAARIYLVRHGKVAPVARSVPSLDSADLLLALRQGPTAEERAAGLTTAVPARTRSSGLGRPGLAQVVYTLSQTDPSQPVSFQGHSYTRADFEEQSPAILVEAPLPFAHVTSPLRATGTANTFEATFQYELKDAGGKVLAKHFVTATSGNGVRGTFDVTIPFEVAHPGPGTLTVYENDAATGKRINEVEIPLQLEP